MKISLRESLARQLNRTQEVQHGSYSIREMAEQLLSMNDRQFGNYAFYHEPLAGKFSEAEKQEMIRNAIRCGEETAESYIRKDAAEQAAEISGSKAAEAAYRPWQEQKAVIERRTALVCRDTGVSITKEELPAGGGHVIFAQYEEPDRIVIFTDCLRQYEKLRERAAEAPESADDSDREQSAGSAEVSQNVESREMTGILETVESRKMTELLPTSEEVEAILLGHELFHAVEYRRKDTIYTQTEKVELWRKPFSNRSRILALSEIAAMSFAKRLTGCAFSPAALDVLLLAAYNRDAACALYEEILEAGGEAF